MRRWAPRTTLCQVADNLPIIEASLDERGPLKKRQFDTSELMDRRSYSHLHPSLSDWRFCNAAEAQPYLPFDKPARQAVLGIHDKKQLNLLPGASAHLVDVMPKKRGLLINVAAAVNGLAFAPKRPSADSEPCTEYLAVGCYQGAEDETREIAVQTAYKNCIQLWRLRLSSEEPLENTLDLCILHEYGPVLGIEWCPYGTYEETTDDEKQLPKLGILSAVFGDGSVRVMIIPHPKALRRQLEIQDPNETIYMRLDRAHCVIGPCALLPTTHAWGGTQRLAIGYDNGSVRIYNMQKALAATTPINDMDDYIESIPRLGESAMRKLAWNGIDEPVNLIATGNDGCISIIDVRDPDVCATLLRSRYILRNLAWPGYTDVIQFTDADEYSREVFTLDTDDLMMGQKMADNAGRTLCMAAAESHPFTVIGSQDGYVKCYNSHFHRRKGKSSSVNIVYRLYYDEANKTFHYVDGLKPMSIDDSKKMPDYIVCEGLEPSINEVAWCPNMPSAAWIASGGPAGLLRIDFTGRGDEWA